MIKLYNVKKTTAVLLSFTLCTSPIFSNKVLAQASIGNSIDEKVKTEEITLNEKESIVSNYFDEIKSFYDTLTREENIEKITFQSKKYFIQIVDFFFYEGNINGITFQELTNDGKTYLLDKATNLLSKLEEWSPGIEQELLDLYLSLLQQKEIYAKEINEWISSTLSFLNETQKDTLNHIKDRAMDVINGLTKEINEKYENFRKDFTEQYDEKIFEVENSKVKMMI